jgi:hypothetical protein
MGVIGQRHTPIALRPGQVPVIIAGIWLGSRVGLWGFLRSVNHFPPPGREYLTVHLVEDRYTDYTSNYMYLYALKYWELLKINHNIYQRF